MLKSLSLALSLLVPQDGAEPSEEGRTRLDLRVSPIVDLYMLVRRHAEPDRGFSKVEGREEAPAPEWEGFERAVAAARAIGDRFPTTLFWGYLDSSLEGCETAADLLEAFDKLPATMLNDKRALRGPAMKLAKAVEAIEPEFLKDRWPTHKEALDAVLEQTQTRLLPVQDDCYDFILESFGMPQARRDLLVYLTYEMPPPGGVTFRRIGGGGISFVAVQDVPPTEVFETVLHETMHTLDILTRDQESMLVRLENELLAARLPPRDPRMRERAAPADVRAGGGRGAPLHRPGIRPLR